MKTITLQFDEGTIARLELLGAHCVPSGLSGEILGMDLAEAYQKLKAEESRAPRRPLTFAMLKEFGRARGVTVEKNGRKLEYWRRGASGTIGQARTLKEAWGEIENNLI